MSWDQVTLTILASFGCLTILLTQISEVLSKISQVIRVWHEVRRTLRSGPGQPTSGSLQSDREEPGPGTNREKT